MFCVLRLVNLRHAVAVMYNKTEINIAALTTQGPLISEDETESKEEAEDYVDDLGESPMSAFGLHGEDPDYMPCDADTEQMRKDRKERRKTRGDAKGKKKKLGTCKYVYNDGTV